MRVGPVVLVVGIGCGFSGGTPPEMNQVDAAPPIDNAVGDGRSIDASMICPSNYTTTIGGEQRYRLVTSTINWASAQTDCSNDGTGTHLVVPTTMQEHRDIADAITGATTSAWIGVTDRVNEGSFQIVSGGTTYFVDWYTGASGTAEPDNSGDCVEQVSSDAPNSDDRRKHFDESCTAQRMYICECDGLPSDPTAY